MWNEQNDRHDKSPLSALDEDSALTASGAACASLVLASSEAIALMPSSAGKPRVLAASEIAALPGGSHIRTLVGSRLFTKNSDAADQFKPIRAGSAAARAVELLPHYPVLTVSRLAALLGVSFRAAALGIDQLIEAAILAEWTGYRRNRMFAAPEALSIVNRPFGAEPILPEASG